MPTSELSSSDCKANRHEGVSNFYLAQFRASFSTSDDRLEF